MGVVLAIIALGGVAVIIFSALWARATSWGSVRAPQQAGIAPDELGIRREAHGPRVESGERQAVVTVLRPDLGRLVSGS